MNAASIRLHGRPGWISHGKLWQSAGLVGLAFFLIKGMRWLLIPLAWYVAK